MNYSIKIPIEIFHHQVILIYAESLEDCAKIGRASYNLDIHYDIGYLACTERHGNTTTIALPFSSCSEDPSILVHEVNHAAFSVVQAIGARVSNDTEEVICYLQQYIYKECIKFLNTITPDALNKSE